MLWRWVVWALAHGRAGSRGVWVLAACWLCLPSAWAQVCVPTLLLMEAAKGEALGSPRASNDSRYAPPDQGWVTVADHDDWQTRWPAHSGTVWYRQIWDVRCQAGDAPSAAAPQLPASDAAGLPPLALYSSGLNMAGAVYVNEALLWRNASLVEPLSRSWFSPRAWQVPSSMLVLGHNEVMLQVVGHAAQGAGQGLVLLGDLLTLQARAADDKLFQRTAFMANVLLSGSLGLLFAMVWWMRRQEVAYGWYALMSLFWVLYLSSILAVTPWPFSSSLTFARVNLMLLGLYCTSFCLFTWRFGEQHWPWVERTLLVWMGGCVLLTWLTPEVHIRFVFSLIWFSCMLVFQLNCLQFVVHAWRRGTSELLLLAACWLAFLLVGLHDMLGLLHKPMDMRLLAPFSSLLASVFMSLLLAWRLTGTMRRIEGFNAELERHVTQARLQLASTMRREHAQNLKNAKLQERLELSHDLHDGLGGSLVRAMALVEQTAEPLGNQRVLSLFKVLRDDLRQVIDHGSSANVVVPETPIIWAAPLRHRFTRLFDDMDVSIRWQFPPQWQHQPSAFQCLGMTRVLEEALSNVIKHSRATEVRVSCLQPEAHWLVLEVHDNGVGFDVDAVQSAGLSVGMRSMAARAERMQGRLAVTSVAGYTHLRLTVSLQEGRRAGASVSQF